MGWAWKPSRISWWKKKGLSKLSFEGRGTNMQVLSCETGLNRPTFMYRHLGVDYTQPVSLIFKGLIWVLIKRPCFSARQALWGSMWWPTPGRRVPSASVVAQGSGTTAPIGHMVRSWAEPGLSARSDLAGPRREVRPSKDRKSVV